MRGTCEGRAGKQGASWPPALSQASPHRHHTLWRTALRGQWRTAMARGAHGGPAEPASGAGQGLQGQPEDIIRVGASCLQCVAHNNKAAQEPHWQAPSPSLKPHSLGHVTGSAPRGRAWARASWPRATGTATTPRALQVLVLAPLISQGPWAQRRNASAPCETPAVRRNDLGTAPTPSLCQLDSPRQAPDAGLRSLPRAPARHPPDPPGWREGHHNAPPPRLGSSSLVVFLC